MPMRSLSLAVLLLLLAAPPALAQLASDQDDLTPLLRAERPVAAPDAAVLLGDREAERLFQFHLRAFPPFGTAETVEFEEVYVQEEGDRSFLIARGQAENGECRLAYFRLTEGAGGLFLRPLAGSWVGGGLCRGTGTARCAFTLFDGRGEGCLVVDGEGICNHSING